MLNVEELLQPVRGEAPGGANLEYSPEFAELERTAAGKPERQVGAVVAAAEEPDWRALVAQCGALLKTTKDLRVANHFVRGQLRLEGFGGLADGLELLRGLVERYWTSLHPPLDADDGNDPTFRINAMAALTHRDVLQAIRAAPLLHARGLGTITLRDIEAATTSSGQSPSAEAATLEAIFNQAALSDLAEASRVVDRCCAEARGLAEAWGAMLDNGGPDFTEFRRLLAHASRIVKTHLDQRQAAHDSAEPAHDGATNGSGGAGAAPVGSMVRGDLRSRDDVVRALDAICAYYARHEPSSPVPLLLERCKRLVTMSFFDIVKDMLPEGISTIQTIVGKPKD
jgi:type VI secretion system protein ImpA